MLVLFRSGGIREELYILQRVDFKKLTIYLQHRIVYIIIIYVFYTLLMYTNNSFLLYFKLLYMKLFLLIK
jgi:hypothetical protein